MNEIEGLLKGRDLDSNLVLQRVYQSATFIWNLKYILNCIHKITHKLFFPHQYLGKRSDTNSIDMYIILLHIAHAI